MLRFHDLLIDIAQLLEDEGSEGEKVDLTSTPTPSKFPSLSVGRAFSQVLSERRTATATSFELRVTIIGKESF